MVKSIGIFAVFCGTAVGLKSENITEGIAAENGYSFYETNLLKYLSCVWICNELFCISFVKFDIV